MDENKKAGIFALVAVSMIILLLIMMAFFNAQYYKAGFEAGVNFANEEWATNFERRIDSMLAMPKYDTILVPWTRKDSTINKTK